jgi:hypothetical protein
MGISAIKYPLKEQLNEIDKELRERFNLSIQYARSDEKLNPKTKRPFLEKPSILFEYFTLYNSVLALEPDEIKISLKSRGGASFLTSGRDPGKSVLKYGETLEPAIVAKKSGRIFNFWFDRPFIYFEEKLATLRPDVVIREGIFEFKEILTYRAEKSQLFKNGELIAEFGIYPPQEDLEGYEIKISKETIENSRIYFRFKEEFIYFPLVIEAKGFGAPGGGIDEYANFGRHVIILTPDRGFYEPKKENIHIIHIQNTKRISNQEARKKLKEFYQKYLL